MSGNQLEQETSPYLLLHKDNPVHWRPWGPAAFEEAESTGKPILLSIGYTACHWCHVMSAESFGDPEVAALMNEGFVNIKVDREERPDIDQIYQTAAPAMGHAGGWPLTMFLTPRGEPFVAGSYFPREDRAGQAAFKRVLPDVVRLYNEQPEPVANTVARVQAMLAQLVGARPARTARRYRRRRRRGQIVRSATTSSMAASPPCRNSPPPASPMLWRGYLRSGCRAICAAGPDHDGPHAVGGLYDHVGGGFSRYTIDERWYVPHFEKMLYDNAQILELLALLSQHNRRRSSQPHRRHDRLAVARNEVGDAFASRLDADSDGEEGRYYIWTEAEIDAALAGTFAPALRGAYGVRREGNCQGRNVLQPSADALPADPMPTKRC